MSLLTVITLDPERSLSPRVPAVVCILFSSTVTLISDCLVFKVMITKQNLIRYKSISYSQLSSHFSASWLSDTICIHFPHLWPVVMMLPWQSPSTSQLASSRRIKSLFDFRRAPWCSTEVKEWGAIRERFGSHVDALPAKLLSMLPLFFSLRAFCSSLSGWCVCAVWCVPGSVTPAVGQRGCFSKVRNGFKRLGFAERTSIPEIERGRARSRLWSNSCFFFFVGVVCLSHLVMVRRKKVTYVHCQILHCN